MLLPSIFRNNFVDNFFDDMFDFNFPFNNHFMTNARLMNTDIQDLGNEYQLDIELPGYNKEDIRAELNNGYLTVYADKEDNKEVKKNGKYVRRERYSGKCRRSFYVGDYLKEEDIRASFKNGVLRMVFPKDQNAVEVDTKKYIPID
ncbi:MAG: Hsp20/alpha crystallin family protein [Clostridiales bacterium]|nr:Hsp20/alpha crystallin family protein [Clostridiales bacterium]